ncbi:MAG TPA: DUF2202 domain-containing protein [Myxococcales bacterium]|nr:DUF2202 domain-containing protein [Deltaproteobacteria bacterium]HAA54402.1 DUF2202 domain-containing protein [Myxococcales bacterium]
MNTTHFRMFGLILLGGLWFTVSACGSPGTLTQEVQEAMKEALLDEYKAEATYNKIIAKFGPTDPFSNIMGAETKHSTSLEKMYDTYQLTPPDNPYKDDDSSLPDFASVKEACEGGVQAEIANIAIYDRWLKMELPDNIKTVFTSLRDASRDKHLPAFQKCAK